MSPCSCPARRRCCNQAYRVRHCPCLVVQVGGCTGRLGVRSRGDDQCSGAVGSSRGLPVPLSTADSTVRMCTCDGCRVDLRALYVFQWAAGRSREEMCRSSTRRPQEQYLFQNGSQGTSRPLVQSSRCRLSDANSKNRLSWGEEPFGTMSTRGSLWRDWAGNNVHLYQAHQLRGNFAPEYFQRKRIARNRSSTQDCCIAQC